MNIYRLEVISVFGFICAETVALGPLCRIVAENMHQYQHQYRASRLHWYSDESRSGLGQAVVPYNVETWLNCGILSTSTIMHTVVATDLATSSPLCQMLKAHAHLYHRHSNLGPVPVPKEWLVAIQLD